MVTFKLNGKTVQGEEGQHHDLLFAGCRVLH